MNRIKLIKLNSSFHFNFVEDENRLDSIIRLSSTDRNNLFTDWRNSLSCSFL